MKLPIYGYSMSRIATSSVEDGLDFAFNLLVGPAAKSGAADTQTAAELLSTIDSFVTARYAGEWEIALGFLEAFASSIPSGFKRNQAQIEEQLGWLRMQLPADTAT